MVAGFILAHQVTPNNRSRYGSGQGFFLLHWPLLPDALPADHRSQSMRHPMHLMRNEFMDEMKDLLHRAVVAGLDGDLQALLMARMLISHVVERRMSLSEIQCPAIEPHS